MREKAIERRNINKEHNSNFKAGYVPIEEERLHKTGLRGRKGNMAVCIVILLFILALINLIVSNTNVNLMHCLEYTTEKYNTKLAELHISLCVVALFPSDHSGNMDSDPYWSEWL